MTTIKPSSPTYSDQLARRAAELLPDMNEAERLELLAVMDEGDMRASLAWLAVYAPQLFDYALVRDRAMVDRLQERLDHQYDNDPEPFCSVCGQTIGIFRGHGGGYHHYTGEGTVASPVELYDAGHAPMVAWREGGAQ